MQGLFKDNYSSLPNQIKKVMGDEHAVNVNLVRSINVSLNNLIKLPEGLTKSLIILNVSRNRLKSLSGVEVCTRLVFLNASHNQIQTVSTISTL